MMLLGWAMGVLVPPPLLPKRSLERNTFCEETKATRQRETRRTVGFFIVKGRFWVY